MTDENECDRIYDIKWGIVSKIFLAGANWEDERLTALTNGNGKMSKEVEEKLEEKFAELVETYCDVVDEVWGDYPDDDEDDDPIVCDECHKKLDEDFKKEFQDKKDTK